MKDRFRTIMNVLLNIALLVAIIGVTYSWMLTLPSSGELADYERQLVITSSSVTVKVYAYTGGQYVEQTTSPMNLGLLAPGVMQRYRFDITNTTGSLASTKIVLSNITGDLADLNDYLVFGSTSPKVFVYTMGSKILQNPVDSTYYLNLSDEVKIPGNSTVSVYWYASILNTATNEISNKEILIDNIAFIKP